MRSGLRTVRIGVRITIGVYNLELRQSLKMCGNVKNRMSRIPDIFLTLTLNCLIALACRKG